MPNHSRPSLLTRISRAVKAANMVFNGMGGTLGGPYSGSGSVYGDWYGRSWQPGASFRYEEEVGNLWDNSAFAACVNFIQVNFPQACLCVTEPEGDGEEKQIADHPLAILLKRPNPHFSGRRLWMSTVLDFAVDGNAYWMKARASQGWGQPIELWWVPTWSMRAAYPQDGSEYLSGYIRTVNNRQTFVPREDVIHFRWGTDPQDERRGRSPISAAIRQIAGDNAAATYVAAILRNMGISPDVWSPSDGDAEIPVEEAQLIKQQLLLRATDEHRGEPMISRWPLKRDTSQRSPDELMLNDIINYFEERICALMLIPPMVVGLGSGLDRSTYSNSEQAHRAAYQNCVMPMQQIMADELQAQLLPDLGDSDRQTVGWDYTKVPALQEDQNALRDSVSTAVKAGWIKISDARKLFGLPSAPED